MLMTASLVPRGGGDPVILDRPIMLIGRGADCEIPLQNSAEVSRRHCFIVQSGQKYWLRDLGSTNGVRVNNKRVVEEELRPGDEIAVADAVFILRIDGTAAPSSRGFPQRHREPARIEPDSVRIDSNDHDQVEAEVADEDHGALRPDEVSV
jgi:pSer/pThr/pTyr-binding forkhead associated (FHA) protein